MEHEGKHTYDTVMAYMSQISEDSERGQALLSCSLLEDTLGRILKAFLRDADSSHRLLEGFNAPFGSFTAKIMACNSMGLLSDDEMSEIEIHRKIRNKFAHVISMNFENQSVVDLCANLELKLTEIDGYKPTPRENYLSSTMQLNLILISRLSKIPDLRLKAQFENDQL
jgi:hypothetical protein